MRLPITLLSLTALVAVAARAQQRLTPPETALGHPIGADYFLPNYTQLMHWWQQLATESPRMKLDTIGLTAEGRPQLMAIISSGANLAKLEDYRRINATLARARVDSAAARRLAQTGKAVVWIDGGLHADEVLGANQLLELVWQMVSRNDPETLRFLQDDILLAVQVNPDGMELVANWYMRTADSLQRSTRGVPRLYEKYAGHDDNRDWYRAALPETQNGERIQYLTWYPQIIYNHHQTGPAGSVIFMPPFRDPFNYYFDPLIPTSLDWVSMAMQRRFAAEGKGGFVSKNASDYSTWWNGGLRTAGYFHNMIGILTEAIGNPTPETIPIVLSRQLPDGNGPMPVQWGPWHFRQSIDYSMTADRAVLDVASKNRESLLYDFWVMGHREIAEGETNSWTTTPKTIEAADSAAARVTAAASPSGRGGGRGGNPAVQQAYQSVLRDPARRDPRAYVIPSDQPEFAQALDFLQALARAGIEINKITADFTIAGKRYSKGSFLVPASQAFRPHVLDMFEPQWYPMDLEYPGGPPKRPYDVAGYTLAYQMGFSFDRILDSFARPPMVAEPLGSVTPDAAPFDAAATGWILSPASNDAFLALNRLAKANQHVERLAGGDFLAPASATSARILGDLARTRGLATRNAPAGTRGTPVKPLRIGLWDQYGGSMPAGWARWILEHYESPFTRVFAPRLNAGDLGKDFDVLVFLGGIPGSGAGRGGRGFGGRGAGGRGGNAEQIPDEYRDQIGSMSVDTTMPQIKAFLEQGGVVIAIGTSATNLAQNLGLPVENQVQGISNEKYYIPGSVLQVAVDTTQPAAAGAHAIMDVFFDNSPVWHLGDNAASFGIRKIAWFAAPDPLRSGWAIGKSYLKDGVEMFSAPVGRGMAYFYAPDVTFRAQPEGSFKFLFNTFYGDAPNQ
ncbi:MAG: M14 family metallopeptidase [Gemmatimonadales bacterium]